MVGSAGSVAMSKCYDIQTILITVSHYIFNGTNGVTIWP